jgi:hypothetical protein
VDMWLFKLGFSFQGSNVDFATSSWTWIWGVSNMSPASSTEYAAILNYSALNPNPMGRAGHSMTALPSSQTLLVFGGSNVELGGVIYFNDVWEFNVSSQKWAWIGGSSTIPQNSNFAGITGKYPPSENRTGSAFQYYPSARTAHAACLLGTDSFYIFGGQNHNYSLGMPNFFNFVDFILFLSSR